MVQNSNDNQKHKRNIILGSMMLVLSAICIFMTIMFVYVNNSANQRIDDIRKDYQRVAERRDEKVAKIAGQVEDLQKKVDGIPDRTATKTADKVKQVVTEDEKK
ncbi:hypothetical protein N5580_13165 [Pantoea piersonii]|uniref:Uncharacterized protein n=1 Tax=Pantoea piersonii TaxID=2364647 RepID=A0AAJ5U8N2_9GAMM|nr:hypothetical protein [Pantoea piersonii]WBG90036.1 hypothetical protein N5580_13165 [Pantoea piersonii]